MKTKLSGLEIEEISEGTGAMAERGKLVSIHCRGFLNRGEQFQNTYETAPVQFIIGKREIIAGLETGVIGMRVGGRRRLIIGPHLAYREKGVEGRIPPNAVLKYEVELLEVRDV